ncbi:hypothetical protein Awo_c27470 [Acetobacterium woodii DSM 1030]|uniref:Uncharacterized protein n=1 Tax=Acetobacterium woodii (strain ATCC 29683 / DSM 1030 / JCM 2381 / KCTC 1655 / WB1) TaxID=931626 RepID=H6LG22_ACEWD|nr:hypothetical protein Awo_c27470 [Acetobacterium woodii DSM 1030]
MHQSGHGFSLSDSAANKRLIIVGTAAGYFVDSLLTDHRDQLVKKDK